jgi:hypothetical protein
VTPAIGYILGDLVSPDHGPGRGIYGAEYAYIAEGVEQRSLVVLAWPVEEGRLNLGDAEERVVEVDIIDLILIDGRCQGGESQQKQGV